MAGDCGHPRPNTIRGQLSVESSCTRLVSTQNLQLSLLAEPESVARARRAVGEFAESLGIEEPQLGDLKTVVSEASSNVVRHAYPAEPGIFELEARPIEGELAVVVRDFGQGMQARLPEGEPSLRLGIRLISMLSSHYEIRGHEGGGTEVRASVSLQA
jgi:anti-sigma regulatory factor (Ser/Thr protein kinase)